MDMPQSKLNENQYSKAQKVETVVNRLRGVSDLICPQRVTFSAESVRQIIHALHPQIRSSGVIWDAALPANDPAV